MSLSDRSSRRVVEQQASPQVRPSEPADRGADDGHHRDHPPRLGRRQLAAIATSLTDRDHAILLSLAELHFLTSRHVERLHFRSPGTSPLAAARASRRALVRLHGLRLVDRLERRIGGVRAGSASHVITLAPLGSRLLAIQSRRRSRQPSTTHLDHVLEVAELVVRLHEAASIGRLEHVGYHGEPGCWRTFLAPHGGRSVLKPDLRLSVDAGDHELHWYVEIDRSSEHQPVLRRKNQTYLDAWREGTETARDGVFPRVCWVVPDQHRQAVIEQVIASLRPPAGMFHVSTTIQAIDVLLDHESGL